MLKTTIKNTYIIFTLVLLFIITGCGYHLRGLNQDSLNIEDIYIDTSKIDSNDINNLFIHNLSNNFRSKNIKILSTHDIKSKNILELTYANYSKMIISKGSSNLVSQYKIIFNIKFNFLNNNKLILADQNITTQRNYNYTQDQILGLEDEHDVIIREIIQEVSDKVINQLGTVTK